MSIAEVVKKINIPGLLALSAGLLLILIIGGVELKALQANRESIKIDRTAMVADVSVEKMQPSVQQLVGSKTGTKYHLPECSGAKNISDKNKIFFSSIAEAEKQGYTPAANCPGLKKQ